MLFQVLKEDLFKPLAGKYAKAYASLLWRLRDGLFSVDMPDTPTRQEVVGDLGEGLRLLVAALPDDEAAEFRLDAADAYAELLSSGWVYEQREAWTTYVEIEPVVSRLLECLCSLPEVRDESFGGAMVTVFGALEGAVADPDVRAVGVVEAADRACRFARHVRTVVGALKTVEKTMLAQASVNGLVRTFFDDFVANIVMKDFRHLTVARNHPYGFKYRIAELLDQMEAEPDLVERLRGCLVAQGISADPAAASDLLSGSSRGLRASMEAIEGFRARIDLTKSRIEQRFGNTLRYMDLLDGGLGERFVAAMTRFGRGFATSAEEGASVEVATHLLEPPRAFDESRTLPPQTPRRAFETVRMRQPQRDPLRAAFDRARADFDRRLTITPERFVGYVRAKLARRGAVSAADIPPTDVEEFIIFSNLRTAATGRVALPDGVSLVPLSGRTVENDWMICGDFQLVRDLSPDRRSR